MTDEIRAMPAYPEGEEPGSLEKRLADLELKVELIDQYDEDEKETVRKIVDRLDRLERRIERVADDGPFCVGPGPS